MVFLMYGDGKAMLHVVIAKIKWLDMYDGLNGAWPGVCA